LNQQFLYIKTNQLSAAFPDLRVEFQPFVDLLSPNFSFRVIIKVAYQGSLLDVVLSMQMLSGT